MYPVTHTHTHIRCGISFIVLIPDKTQRTWSFYHFPLIFVLLSVAEPVMDNLCVDDVTELIVYLSLVYKKVT